MLLGSLLYIEVIFEKSSQGVCHAQEQLLSWCVHQYVARYAPFSLRVIHFSILCMCIDAAYNGSGHHQNSKSFHLVLFEYND